jgi:hypothetical protein
MSTNLPLMFKMRAANRAVCPASPIRIRGEAANGCMGTRFFVRAIEKQADARAFA